MWGCPSLWTTPLDPTAWRRAAAALLSSGHPPCEDVLPLCGAANVSHRCVPSLRQVSCLQTNRHSTEVARPPRQGYRPAGGEVPPNRLPCPRPAAGAGPSTPPPPTPGAL